jgi:hypothetical protein
MIESPQELVRQLRLMGLVPAGAEPEGSSAPARERPWYIGLILGTAGWVAGIFVLIFVFMLFHGGGLFAGPLLLAAAWGLFRIDRDGAFVAQLALALSIAGQFLLVFWLGDSFLKHSNDVAGVAFVALLLQVALVIVMPNRLHRTMSAFFACIAWALLVRYALWDEPFWSSRPRPELPLGLAMLGWAIVWLPIAGLLYVAIRRETEWMARGLQAIVRPAAVGLIIGLAITTLLSQPFETFPFAPTQSPGGRAIWPLLSAAAALGALAAAFALGNRGLTALCVLAALLHVSHFYYAMGTSLLTKSLTMIAAGVILLSTAYSLRKQLPPAEDR